VSELADALDRLAAAVPEVAELLASADMQLGRVSERAEDALAAVAEYVEKTDTALHQCEAENDKLIRQHIADGVKLEKAEAEVERLKAVRYPATPEECEAIKVLGPLLEAGDSLHRANQAETELQQSIDEVERLTTLNADFKAIYDDQTEKRKQAEDELERLREKWKDKVRRNAALTTELAAAHATIREQAWLLAQVEQADPPLYDALVAARDRWAAREASDE
jgi:chromosome segregation ATPase